MRFHYTSLALEDEWIAVAMHILVPGFGLTHPNDIAALIIPAMIPISFFCSGSEEGDCDLQDGYIPPDMYLPKMNECV